MAKRMSDWYYTIPKETRKRIRIILSGMTQRCYNAKTNCYQDYGGRGIRVCKEWFDEELNLIRTETFMQWALTHGYKPGLQIDRIDNNGNYEPSNCRFVTPLVNGRNKRNCKPITFNGETLCLSEWAERLGIPKHVIKQRIKRGLPLEKVMVSTKQEKDELVWFRGHKVRLSHLSKRFGVSRSVIRLRLRHGWKVEDAVTKEVGVGHSHFVVMDGERNSIKYFARKYGVRYVRLCELTRAGCPIEEAIRRLKK